MSSLQSATRRDPIDEAHRQWRSHGWEQAADGMATVTALVRVHQILMQRIDAVLRPYDLTFARYEILTLLSFTSRGSMPMSRMGTLLQVHPTSVTSAVDRLQAQALVMRVPHPTDRRAVLATITPAGRRRVQEATEALNREVFEQPGLAPDRVAELRDILREMRLNAGDISR